MAKQLFANNFKTYLASGIGATDTSMTVSSATGAPTITGGSGDWWLATLVKTDGSKEIVKVTARTGTVCTIERAQEGTTALAFTADPKTVVSGRLTAGTLTRFEETLAALITSWAQDPSNQVIKWISDIAGNTKIQIDEDSTIRFTVGGDEQVTLEDGVLAPSVNEDINIGTALLRLGAIFSAAATFDTLTLNGASPGASQALTRAQSDARYAQLSNNLSDLADAATALASLGLGATATEIDTVCDGATVNASEINMLDGAYGMGLVVGGSMSYSSQAYVDFTSLNPAFIYELLYNISATNCMPYIQINGDTGNNYRYLQDLVNYAAASPTHTQTATGSTDNIRLGSDFSLANASGRALIVPVIGATSRVKVSIVGSHQNADGSSYLYRCNNDGFYNGASALTSIRFRGSTGYSFNGACILKAHRRIL